MGFREDIYRERETKKQSSSFRKDIYEERQKKVQTPTPQPQNIKVTLTDGSTVTIPRTTMTKIVDDARKQNAGAGYRMLEATRRATTPTPQTSTPARQAAEPIIRAAAYPSLDQHETDMAELRELEAQKAAKRNYTLSNSRMPISFGNVDAAIANKKQQMQTADRTRDLARYQLLTYEPDFEIKSRYQSTKRSEPTYNPYANNRILNTGYDDYTYELINKNPEALKMKPMVSAYDVNASARGLGQDELQELTQDEIKIYNYLKAKDRERGTNESEEYLEFLRQDINTRYRVKQEERSAKFAKESPIAASLYNIATAPASVGPAIMTAIDYAGDKELTPNAPYNLPTYQSNARQRAVSEKINEKAGGFWSGAYDLGMNIAEQAYIGALSGGSGAIASSIIASKSFNQGVMDAQDRGLSSKQAITLGTINAAAELITEKIGFDNAFDAIKKGGIGSFKKAIASNAAEEMSSEIITTIADIFVAKDKSQWQEKINKYKKQGYSDNDAFSKAFWETMGEIGLAGIAGAVSAGVMAGPSAVSSAYADNSTGKSFRNDFNSGNLSVQDMQAIITEGLATDKDSGSYKLATKLQEKLDAGKPVSFTEYGKLYNENVKNVDSEYAPSGIEEDKPTEDNISITSNKFSPFNKAREEDPSTTLRSAQDDTGNTTQRFAQDDTGNTTQRSSQDDTGKTAVTPGFRKTEYSKKITNKTIRALDAIGKKLGVEIEIGEPTGKTAEAYNGKYENGKITIAQDAENPLEVVLSHEVTHHMQRTAPTEYATFAEMAIEASTKLSGTEKTGLIERYKKAYSEGTQTNFTEAAAIDEITADYAGRLVREIDTFKKLADADITLAQRFIASVKEFITKVKSAFSTDKTKADTAAMEKYGATVAELEAAVKTYEGRINTTQNAVKSGQFDIENTAETEQGGVKYDLKSETNREENTRLTEADFSEYMKTGRKQHTRNAKNRLVEKGETPILYSDKEIKKFVDESIDGTQQGEVRVYGKVGERLARDVKRLNKDVDIYGKYLELTSDKIKHAYDEHHKAKEPGDIDLSVEDFEKITDYIDNYDYVLNTETYNGAQKIRIAKKINGYTVILSLVSKERDSLHPIDMIGLSTKKFEKKYMEKKSVGSREETTAKAESPNPRTAVTYTDHTLSTVSIPDSSEKSNPQNSLKTGDLLSKDYTAPKREGTVQAEENPEVVASETESVEKQQEVPKKESNVRFKRLDAEAKQTKKTEPDAKRKAERVEPGEETPEESGSYLEESGFMNYAKDIERAETEQTEKYIEKTGLDKYLKTVEEKAQVIADKEAGGEEKRLEEANKSLLDSRSAEKKTWKDNLEDSTSFVMRKFVNSGDAIRKIADKTENKTLYGVYNRARASMNIVNDMLTNKQTNVRGAKVGESLEDIIKPIKDKGKDYYRDFQLYLLHKHNVSRMSIYNSEDEKRARAQLMKFNSEYPEFATMSEKKLQSVAEFGDRQGMIAKMYIGLRDGLRKAEVQNKPIFFDKDDVPIDAAMSRRFAKETIKKHPEFAEYEAKVRKYIDNLMDYRVESGLITEKDAEYFRKKYPYYVPTYRNTEDAWKQISGNLSIGKAIGKARGGNDPILPLDIALAEMTKKVVRNGQKNIVMRKLYEENGKSNLTKYIKDVTEGQMDAEAEIEEFGDAPTADNTIRFNVDGRSVEMTVTPALYEAFEGISRAPKENPKVVKAIKDINDGYKKLITTYDPTFIVRNGLKDVQDAALNSRDAAAMLKNYPRALKEIATGGEMWELYRAAGGLYSSQFEELHEKGIQSSDGKKGVKKAVGKTKEKLAMANLIVEQAPRLAEFMAVLEKGDVDDADNVADVLLAAAEITTNFGESGTWGKVLNAYYIPFLNPAIQGTAQMLRTFKRKKTAPQWMAFAAKTLIMGAGAGFANDIIMSLLGSEEDKEEYGRLKERTKDNYFLFPMGDGKFIKLPKGRVTAALGIINDRVRDATKGEKVDGGEAFQRILENVAPENPFNNNILKPLWDSALLDDDSKGRTWYGGDIESDRMQGLPAGERFDGSTDYLSRFLGKTLGVSPKKVNYILQQYTGGAGRMILPAITPSKNTGDTIPQKALGAVTGPWVSSFTVDSKTENKVSGEFYDAVDEAEQEKNSEKGTLADQVVYKHLNRERNQMSEYNTKIRKAEVDENLTSKERNVAVRAASAERTAYQKTILKNVEKYRESVEKYLNEYPGKDESKKTEYAYQKANKEIYGPEYAIRVNGGADVYKKAEEKVKSGKTTWSQYYDEYFGKTERKYKAISKRFSDIDYVDFEKIAEAISKNDKKEDEISAITRLGYKRGVATVIRNIYTETK